MDRPSFCAISVRLAPAPRSSSMAHACPSARDGRVPGRKVAAQADAWTSSNGVPAPPERSCHMHQRIAEAPLDGCGGAVGGQCECGVRHLRVDDGALGHEAEVGVLRGEATGGGGDVANGVPAFSFSRAAAASARSGTPTCCTSRCSGVPNTGGGCDIGGASTSASAPAPIAPTSPGSGPEA